MATSTTNATRKPSLTYLSLLLVLILVSEVFGKGGGGGGRGGGGGSRGGSSSSSNSGRLVGSRNRGGTNGGNRNGNGLKIFLIIMGVIFGLAIVAALYCILYPSIKYKNALKEAQENVEASGNKGVSGYTERPKNGKYTYHYKEDDRVNFGEINFSFLETSTGWTIMGNGSDCDGEFVIEQGLLSYSGDVYWTEYQESSKRSVLCTGKYMFERGQVLEGHWLASNGKEGALMTFAYHDQTNDDDDDDKDEEIVIPETAPDVEIGEA